MWRSPWHLKHLLVFKWLGFGQFYEARHFGGAWVFCGVEEGNVVGLGGGKELPLLKG